MDSRPIGMFDSGMGGISVLKTAWELLPDENFVYFGDDGNAPYGVRPVEEIKRLLQYRHLCRHQRHPPCFGAACYQHGARHQTRS